MISAQTNKNHYRKCEFCEEKTNNLKVRIFFIAIIKSPKYFIYKFYDNTNKNTLTN